MIFFDSVKTSNQSKLAITTFKHNKYHYLPTPGGCKYKLQLTGAEERDGGLYCSPAQMLFLVCTLCLLHTNTPFERIKGAAFSNTKRLNCAAVMSLEQQNKLSRGNTLKPDSKLFY